MDTTRSEPEKIHFPAAYTEAMTDGTFSFDEFQALEQKVLRAVEVVKREREARAAAEAEVARLQEQLAERAATAESQVVALTKERETVRQRVEKMLAQMDELL